MKRKQILSLLALMAVIFPLLQTPASAYTKKFETNISYDGQRRMAVSGRHHYSYRHDVGFNEFCIDDSVADGQLVSIKSTIAYDQPGPDYTSVQNYKTGSIRDGGLFCFRHDFYRHPNISFRGVRIKIEACVQKRFARDPCTSSSQYYRF